MFFRVIVAAFGSDWKLKRLCATVRQPLLKKALIKLYGAYQYENGSSIAWDSEFEDTPYFPHGIKSIFISGGAKIGARCVIFQQVTIGSNTLVDSGGRGAPQIGSDCYIGAGAMLIGNVRVGNNVRIGANVVVYKDVPDNCVVLSGEQKIIERSTPLDNRFYSRQQKRWAYFEGGRWVPVTDAAVLSRLSS